jgi:hypothetical protein
MGVRASSLDADQQQVLRALLDVYIGRIPEALADEEAANHVHTVWPDPEGDFGADVLRAHRLSSH